MIHVTDFIKMLSIENSLIQTQTAGLNQADTLIQPAPSGNCMNWVLGHTLENQIELLTTLGGESPLAGATLAVYGRESEPVRADGPGVLPLETLLDGHARLHAALAARLAEMTDADFDREVRLGERVMSLGWRVFFLHFHYTYHIGQLELLRQLAGKTEKLI
jgi:hypothetical protein